MSIFDREPVNRKDRRKLAKELQKEQEPLLRAQERELPEPARAQG